MRVIREDNNINTAIDAMINSFDSQDEPMLGAFWYDPRKQEVFGVKATPARDCKWYKSPQFGIETRTGNALHVNIWKKEQLDDQKHHHQLDDNDHPQRTPDSHILKAIAIHQESVSKERFYSHNATKKATKKRLKHH